MSEIRLNFLNYRPALEDVNHDGLTVANNVVHEPEGYKPVHIRTTASFSTTGGLAASSASITSVFAKPVGTQGDYFCAWLSGSPGTLHFGLNGVTATSAGSAGGSLTGYPLSFATATAGFDRIYAFDVCEYAGKIFFVAEARFQEQVGTVASIRHIGYMDF